MSEVLEVGGTESLDEGVDFGAEIGGRAGAGSMGAQQVDEELADLGVVERSEVTSGGSGDRKSALRSGRDHAAVVRREPGEEDFDGSDDPSAKFGVGDLIETVEENEGVAGVEVGVERGGPARVDRLSGSAEMVA